jgi:hypothetical protein
MYRGRGIESLKSQAKGNAEPVRNEALSRGVIERGKNNAKL